MPSDRPGYVYFIQAEPAGPIKIGMTNSPPVKRLRELCGNSIQRYQIVGAIQTESPLKLETSLHAKFAGIRLRSEWFRPVKSLVDYINREACMWRDMSKPKPGPEREIRFDGSGSRNGDDPLSSQCFECGRMFDLGEIIHLYVDGEEAGYVVGDCCARQGRHKLIRETLPSLRPACPVVGDDSAWRPELGRRIKPSETPRSQSLSRADRRRQLSESIPSQPLVLLPNGKIRRPS